MNESMIKIEANLLSRAAKSTNESEGNGVAIIDFMKFRSITAVLSIFMVLASIISLGVKTLNLGLDFTGGVLVEVAYEQPVALESVRSALKSAGYEDSVAQYFGKETEVLVRLPPQAQDVSPIQSSNEESAGDNRSARQDTLGARIYDDLQKASVDNQITLKRVEFVGPQVGNELRDQSGVAMLFALGCMLLYVTFRFKFKFAVGAVAALFHDVLIVLGFFSLFNIQFDLTVLAAVLAVIGYSLNDTIVVSDRIRENFRLITRGDPVDIVNESLAQTLTRTVMTSLTTLLVLLALLIFGGELISGFATALTVGVIIGTYSSIYVASSIAVGMKVCREDFIELPREELDDRP